MTTKTRDPEGRRRAIVQAAAELISELGFNEVTHRKVAQKAGVPLGSTTQYFSTLDELKADAVVEMSQDIQRELDQLSAELASAEDVPRALAQNIREFVADAARIRREIALYLGSIDHDRLKPLLTLWYDGLSAELSKYTSPAAARIISLYADGVMLHAAHHDAPLGEEELTQAIRLIMESAPTS